MKTVQLRIFLAIRIEDHEEESIRKIMQDQLHTSLTESGFDVVVLSVEEPFEPVLGKPKRKKEEGND